MLGVAAGPTWIWFQASPRLTGIVVWDDPSAEHARGVLRAMEADLALPPHAFYCDARRLTDDPDPGAFQAVVEHLAPRWADYQTVVDKCGIALPRKGMGAAVVSGFFNVARPPFPIDFFAEPIEALEWLGDADPAARAAEIERLREQTSGTPELVLRLRAWLEQNLMAASMDPAARELGLSRRSLQRKLHESSTSFKAELDRARIDTACRLLDGGAKITAVALEVGCASSQSFSALFRRLTGMTPSQRREQSST